MKRALFRKGLRLLVHLLTLGQIALFAGMFWLHRLSFRRGGFNHHLSFMKRKVEKLYLTESVATVLTAVALMLALFLLFRGGKAFLKKGGWGSFPLVLSSAFAFALVAELQLSSLKALPVWPVLLGGTALAFVMQLFKISLLNAGDGEAHSTGQFGNCRQR